MESNLDFKIHVQKFCFFWQVHFVYYQTSSVGKTISLKQVPGFGRGNTHSVGWWQQKSCHWQFDSVLFYWDKGISSILAMNKSNNVCRLEASDQVLSTSLAAGTSHQKLMWTRTCLLKTVCEDMDTFCRKSAHTHHKIFVANCDLSVLQKLDGVFALAKSQSSFAPLVTKAEVTLLVDLLLHYNLLLYVLFPNCRCATCVYLQQVSFAFKNLQFANLFAFFRLTETSSRLNVGDQEVKYWTILNEYMDQSPFLFYTDSWKPLWLDNAS